MPRVTAVCRLGILWVECVRLLSACTARLDAVGRPSPPCRRRLRVYHSTRVILQKIKQHVAKLSSRRLKSRRATPHHFVMAVLFGTMFYSEFGWELLVLLYCFPYYHP